MHWEEELKEQLEASEICFQEQKMQDMKLSAMDREEFEKRLKWYSSKYGPYIEKKGLHNWKNLFRKPTLYEWIILFMLFMMLFVAWAYQRDIALCRQFIEQQNFTINYTQPKQNLNPNLTNFTFNEGKSEDDTMEG